LVAALKPYQDRASGSHGRRADTAKDTLYALLRFGTSRDLVHFETAIHWTGVTCFTTLQLRTPRINQVRCTYHERIWRNSAAGTGNGEDLNPHFEQMSLEDLWNLRENIQLALTNKIGLQKLRLENRLAELARNPAGGKARRPYPQVLPKYQNPANPGQTWSGRRKQPAWVVAQLKSGKKLDDLAIKAVDSL
jgi:DNA-binding protein H-NS